MRCMTNCLRVSSTCRQIAYMVKQLNIAINSLNNSQLVWVLPFLSLQCWCIMNKRIVYTCSYKRLLTNLLPGKAAELELANS